MWHAWERRKMYKFSVGKPEGKSPAGRHRRRWEDGIRINLREIGWGWIQLVQDRYRRQALVNIAMLICVCVGDWWMESYRYVLVFLAVFYSWNECVIHTHLIRSLKSYCEVPHRHNEWPKREFRAKCLQTLRKRGSKKGGCLYTVPTACVWNNRDSETHQCSITTIVYVFQRQNRCI
jgi:hypothetical protein